MKENFDPHQVVISREYFDKLVEMAKPKDHFAGTENRPNQTILARILRHARKFNRALRAERQVKVAADFASRREKRQRAHQIAREYMDKTVYIIDGDNDLPAIVSGGLYPSRVHLRLLVARGRNLNYESIHIDDIIETPRPS